MMYEIKSEIMLKEFLNKVENFHDAIVTELSYVSGSTGAADSVCPIDRNPTIAVVFMGAKCGKIVVRFEGVTRATIAPTPQEYSSQIIEANISYNANKFTFAQFVDNIDDEITLEIDNGITIASQQLFYEIIPY
ncbi:MAG: hypothetical protein R3Y23_07150 [Bacillota bacterium]